MTRLFQPAPLAARRHLLRGGLLGLGALALRQLAGRGAEASEAAPIRARRVICLHMEGGPPQHDLLDWKPELARRSGQTAPDSLLEGQRFAFIQGRPKLLGTPWAFERAGKSGAWVSELLPCFKGVVDEVCVVKSMRGTQFNHAPAQLHLLCGTPRFGHPAMGSWASWGLGDAREDIPAFVALFSGGRHPSGGAALWSGGFLPAAHQGVPLGGGAGPLRFASDPPGLSRESRRRGLDALRRLDALEAERSGDPAIIDRLERHELAFRMQMSVPEAMDISREPVRIRERYGARPGEESFASNCLAARRLAERGARFIQLHDWGWDFHGTKPEDDISLGLRDKARRMDQAAAALIGDLKQRGMLDDTLVLWSGEFGRTPMSEERNGSKYLGRDHQPGCFTLWMAGGGIKPGLSWGESDELGSRPAEGEMSVADLQATVLHLLGLDAETLSFPFQGLDQRLVEPGSNPRIERAILA